MGFRDDSSQFIQAEVRPWVERDRRLRLATQDCYSRKATMGRELMALRTDRTTRIPSDVASPVTTNHVAKGSMFVDFKIPVT